LKNRSFRYYGATGYRLRYRLIILSINFGNGFSKIYFFSVI
jgi:hypothetical protein